MIRDRVVLRTVIAGLLLFAFGNTLRACVKPTRACECSANGHAPRR